MVGAQDVAPLERPARAELLRVPGHGLSTRLPTSA
jgi:hypothetical protein